MTDKNKSPFKKKEEKKHFDTGRAVRSVCGKKGFSYDAKYRQCRAKFPTKKLSPKPLADRFRTRRKSFLVYLRIWLFVFSLKSIIIFRNLNKRYF